MLFLLSVPLPFSPRPGAGKLFLTKGQTANILGFAGHTQSLTNTILFFFLFTTLEM